MAIVRKIQRLLSEEGLALFWFRRAYRGLRHALWRLGVFPEAGSSVLPFVPADERPIRFPPETHAQIERDAQSVLDGKIECFGTIEFRGGASWHTDEVSGTRWSPGRFFTGYRILDAGNGADVKVPWEKSRCHHLIPLAKAFAVGSEGRYAERIETDLLDWMRENPFARSINWTCPMDVAIRAVNWIVALRLTAGFFGGRDSMQGIQRSLLEHLLFVAFHLEKSIEGYSSNHYFADLVGLVFLRRHFGVTLECSVDASWSVDAPRDAGYTLLDELFSETRRQFHESGPNVERAIGYHRLMTEMLLVTLAELRSAGQSIPEDILGRARSAADFVGVYTRQDGSVPQIGDTDDGRFLIAERYSGWRRHDHRHLLAFAHAYFGDRRYAQSDPELYHGPAIFLGSTKHAVSGGVSPGSFRSTLFADAGFGILRTDDAHVTMKAGNRGPHETAGWHTHNDVLAVDVMIHGVPVVVDPGVGEYTGNPGIRNILRGTAQHATVMIDGAEQNRMDDRLEALWAMGGDATTRILSWSDTSEKTEITASHSGYARLNPPVIHRRSVSLEKESSRITIIDEFETTSGYTAQWSWPMHPEVHLSMTSNTSVEIELRGRRVRFQSGLPISLHDGWYSRSYRQWEPSRVLRSNHTISDGLRVVTLIEPLP